MRIFTCQLVFETNTFSSVPTGRLAFEELGIHERDVSLVDPGGVFAVMGEWRRLAESQGHVLFEGLAAQAQPGGITVGPVYEALRDQILEQVRAAAPLDAVLLNLHGAMVAEGYDDCEGDLLTRIRALVGPNVAIGAELDLHCHLTSAMADAADILVGYKHYPHTDILDRAIEVYGLTLARAEGRIKPIISVRDCRMVGLWRTTHEPMAGFVREMTALEESGAVLSASFGHGFPWGDVAEAGAKVWVITDDDAARGDALAADLASRIWALRTDTLTPSLRIEAALDEAQRAPKPVVLADGADNAGGGAPGDSTFILRAILDRGLTDVASGLYFDPMAVAICRQAGVGAKLTLRIGGKTGPDSGDPIDLRVCVRAIAEDHDQLGLNLRWPLGPSVWVEADGRIDLILTSIRSQAFDPEAFTRLGVDLTSKALIVVKSIQHFYERFAPIAGTVLYVSAPGALNTDFAALDYRKMSQNYWPRVSDPFAGDVGRPELAP